MTILDFKFKMHERVFLYDKNKQKYYGYIVKRFAEERWHDYEDNCRR